MSHLARPSFIHETSHLTLLSHPVTLKRGPHPGVHHTGNTPSGVCPSVRRASSASTGPGSSPSLPRATVLRLLELPEQIVELHSRQPLGDQAVAQPRRAACVEAHFALVLRSTCGRTKRFLTAQPFAFFAQACACLPVPHFHAHCRGIRPSRHLLPHILRAQPRLHDARERDSAHATRRTRRGRLQMKP